MSSLNCQGCDWFAKSCKARAKRNCKKMGPSLIVFWPEQWNQHKSTHAKCSKHFDGTFGSPCKLPWPQNITPASQVPNPFVFNLFAPLARGCLNMKHRNIWNYRMIPLWHNHHRTARAEQLSEEDAWQASAARCPSFNAGIESLNSALFVGGFRVTSNSPVICQRLSALGTLILCL